MAIYVDLDGTLAKYEGWKGGIIGEPIPAMMDRVKGWLADGKKVKIFTARAVDKEQIPAVEGWLKANGLEGLPVTCIKGKDGEEFWDDRAVKVERNTGKVLSS